MEPDAYEDTQEQEPDAFYVPGEIVFAEWIAYCRHRWPGMRPKLEWIAKKTGLPRSTCGRYMQRYETVYADHFDREKGEISD